MSYDKEKDRLMRVLLAEVAGGLKAPDLSRKILARAFPVPGGEAAAAWGGQRRWWYIGGAAAMAAAAALVLAVWLGGAKQKPVAPELAAYPEPTASGVYEVAGGGPVRRGVDVVSRDEPATVVLGQYTRVVLAPETRVHLEGIPKAEGVYLNRGEVTCAVDRKIGTFVVRTSAGAVAVTGTRFSVAMQDVLVLPPEAPPMTVVPRPTTAPRSTTRPRGGDRERERESVVTVAPLPRFTPPIVRQRMVIAVSDGAVVASGWWGDTSIGVGQSQTLDDAKPSAMEAGYGLGGMEPERAKNLLLVRFLPHVLDGLDLSAEARQTVDQVLKEQAAARLRYWQQHGKEYAETSERAANARGQDDAAYKAATRQLHRIVDSAPYNRFADVLGTFKKVLSEDQFKEAYQLLERFSRRYLEPIPATQPYHVLYWEYWPLQDILPDLALADPHLTLTDAQEKDIGKLLADASDAAQARLQALQPRQDALRQQMTDALHANDQAGWEAARKELHQLRQEAARVDDLAQAVRAVLTEGQQKPFDAQWSSEQARRRRLAERVTQTDAFEARRERSNPSAGGGESNAEHRK